MGPPLLPLAIKDAGRELGKKRSAGSEWEELIESIELDATMKLLELSYHKLDPELKSCFLHLTFSKENQSMRAEKLTQISATAGMVSEYQTAHCLDELYDESIVEVKDINYYGKKSCCVKAILHRLSIDKAEKEIGFEILSNNGNNRPSQSPRHRVINCIREKFNYSTNQDSLLVSLFFHGGGYFDASSSYWKSFELLRILDFEDFGLKILPQSIGTLMELRYLGLRNNYIQDLPHSLGCLKKLEVLT